MFGRFKVAAAFASMAIATSWYPSTVFGQSPAPERTGTGEVNSQAFKATIELPPDTPEALKRKAREILSWTPAHGAKIDFALKGVTRIVRFADLGFGNRLDVALPRDVTREWPQVNSVRLHLGREKTAVVTRFRIDTLPGPRVRGEGLLGLMGVHGDSLTGREVELTRTMSSAGRCELVFLYNEVWGALACCDLPTTFALSRYGKIGDTLTLIFSFDPEMATYSVSVFGPLSGRTFPGFSYATFRTERGEFHREQTEYPYMYNSSDSGWVNLYVGSRFRGRKSQMEPVLKVEMF